MLHQRARGKLVEETRAKYTSDTGDEVYRCLQCRKEVPAHETRYGTLCAECVERLDTSDARYLNERLAIRTDIARNINGKPILPATNAQRIYWSTGRYGQCSVCMGRIESGGWVTEVLGSDRRMLALSHAECAADEGYAIIPVQKKHT